MMKKMILKFKRTTHKGKHCYEVLGPQWNGMIKWFKKEGFEVIVHKGKILVKSIKEKKSFKKERNYWDKKAGGVRYG